MGEGGRLKELTTWEVRKRLPFGKWKVVDDAFDSWHDAVELELKEASKFLGYFYQWQVRGYGIEK